MAIINVTQPSETIVSLAEAKEHLKVDFVDDDALILGMIAVAVDWVESQLQRRLAARDVDWITDNLINARSDRGEICCRLPLAPVDYQTGVISVTYLKYPYGPAAVLDPSQYIVAPDGQATIICKPYNLIWPWIGQGPEPVKIRFTVGGASLVSPSIKHAIKILVSNMYENRDTAKYGRATPSVMQLTGGALSAIDAMLYADRWQ